MKIKAGDTVILLKTFSSGDRQWKKGTKGKVLRVYADKNQVVVENVRTVFRHLRRSQEHPKGARIEKESPIDASNVAVICPETLEPAKIGYRRLKDGTKVRYCKRSNANIDIE